MKFGQILALLLALAITPWASAAPLEFYGRLPLVEEMRISPDGDRIAYAITDGERRTLIIKTLATGAVIAGLNLGEQKIRNIQWAGSNHLIITESASGYLNSAITRRSEWNFAIDYNLVSKTHRSLLGGDSGSAVVIFGPVMIRMVEGRPFAFVASNFFVDNRGQYGLSKVDLDRGDRLTLIDEGFLNTYDYSVDERGKVISELEYDDPHASWFLKTKDAKWKLEATEKSQTGLPAFEGPGPEGESLLLRFPAEQEPLLREFLPGSTTWKPPAPAPAKVLYDPATHRPLAMASLVGEDTVYAFATPADQKIWKAIVAAFPTDRVELISLSEDHRKFILRADSPTDGPAYALLDLATRKANWIAKEYEGLKPDDIAPVTAITFKAGDGLDLTGYLTLPRARGGKLPLVVLAHDGPDGRDKPGFDWFSQAIASRGYAVLRVNYRGSTGLGWAFTAAGFGQQGRKMQSDLADGVRDLTSRGTIDPARVCIVGRGYGGYAALSGAASDDKTYRCAASIAGESDLRLSFDEARSLFKFNQLRERNLLRYLGSKADLGTISPALHTDRVTIPVLLIHGKDDTVVPFDQSQIMADALRKAGKPVELVTLKKEDHWLSQGDTRLLTLQSVVTFLEKNNPPD